ncbi:MAG: type II toxin-antitoxin system HigB family toxin [Burkholderiales bacterium]|nr:type II toxin-antitoxin system HigB family toxin [Burkholderiales bacterium]
MRKVKALLALLSIQYAHASILANNRVVFNIKGNDYRLIVAIAYRMQYVYVKFIGTHAEYDKLTHHRPCATNASPPTCGTLHPQGIFQPDFCEVFHGLSDSLAPDKVAAA